jgi:hypothetical protein
VIITREDRYQEIRGVDMPPRWLAAGIRAEKAVSP